MYIELNCPFRLSVLERFHPWAAKSRVSAFSELKKIVLSQLWGREFSGFGGPSWEQKSIKNRSKNEVMMGRHLGIDFSWILVDFEGQVGAMLGSKIDQNSIQEGIEML